MKPARRTRVTNRANSIPGTLLASAEPQGRASSGPIAGDVIADAKEEADAPIAAAETAAVDVSNAAGPAEDTAIIADTAVSAGLHAVPNSSRKC